VIARLHPRTWKQATKPETAAAIRDMMVAVVQGGTGTAAQIPGVTVAGKTGTAELSANSRYYDAWFIFFAPAENPVVAGAVLVEHQLNGFGGAVAAPIAKAIMQAILPQASNSKSGSNGH
jgi:peptidoglycan glycosyltransferase